MAVRERVADGDHERRLLLLCLARDPRMPSTELVRALGEMTKRAVKPATIRWHLMMLRQDPPWEEIAEAAKRVAWEAGNPGLAMEQALLVCERLGLDVDYGTPGYERVVGLTGESPEALWKRARESKRVRIRRPQAAKAEVKVTRIAAAARPEGGRALIPDWESRFLWRVFVEGVAREVETDAEGNPVLDEDGRPALGGVVSREELQAALETSPYVARSLKQGLFRARARMIGRYSRSIGRSGVDRSAIVYVRREDRELVRPELERMKEVEPDRWVARAQGAREALMEALRERARAALEAAGIVELGRRVENGLIRVFLRRGRAQVLFRRGESSVAWAPLKPAKLERERASRGRVLEVRNGVARIRLLQGGKKWARGAEQLALGQLDEVEVEVRRVVVRRDRYAWEMPAGALLPGDVVRLRRDAVEVGSRKDVRSQVIALTLEQAARLWLDLHVEDERERRRYRVEFVEAEAPEEAPSEQVVGAQERMTEAGIEALKQEVEALRARRAELVEAVARARELGDLSENAEYQEARKELGMVTGRLGELEELLARVRVAGPGDGRVDVGVVAEIRDMVTGEAVRIRLVGPHEADGVERVSYRSPVGQALMGRAAGEEVEVKTPDGGRVTYRVEGVEELN